MPSPGGRIYIIELKVTIYYCTSGLYNYYRIYIIELKVSLLTQPYHSRTLTQNLHNRIESVSPFTTICHFSNKNLHNRIESHELTRNLYGVRVDVGIYIIELKVGFRDLVYETKQTIGIYIIELKDELTSQLPRMARAT